MRRRKKSGVKKWLKKGLSNIDTSGILSFDAPDGAFCKLGMEQDTKESAYEAWLRKLTSG